LEPSSYLKSVLFFRGILAFSQSYSHFPLFSASPKLGIAVVLVGTDRLDAVIKRDEQVYNRFRACRRFGKLTGEDFVKTVAIWEDKVLKLPVASNLTNKEMLKILLKVTEGYIGRLDEILREAAIKSLSRGFKKVEKAVLEEVAREYG
jgi:DNA transposition AAA+ family ATPase